MLNILAVILGTLWLAWLFIVMCLGMAALIVTLCNSGENQ